MLFEVSSVYISASFEVSSAYSPEANLYCYHQRKAESKLMDLAVYIIRFCTRYL
jgi:hypothetical protein